MLIVSVCEQQPWKAPSCTACTGLDESSRFHWYERTSSPSIGAPGFSDPLPSDWPVVPVSVALL